MSITEEGKLKKEIRYSWRKSNTVFGNGQWMDYTEQLHDALKAQIAEDKKIGIVGKIEISGGDQWH